LNVGVAGVECSLKICYYLGRTHAMRICQVL